MRKRLVVVATISLAGALGVWMSLGANAAVQRPMGSARSRQLPQVVARSTAMASVLHDTAMSASEHRSADVAATATDTDNIQSGDQSGPEESVVESENGSESETETDTVETDNVDCQQEGSYGGVNAAGTGLGCDGTGT